MDDKMYKKPTLIDDVEIYLNLFPIGLVQFLIHLTSDQKNMVNQRSNQFGTDYTNCKMVLEWQ